MSLYFFFFLCFAFTASLRVLGGLWVSCFKSGFLSVKGLTSRSSVDLTASPKGAPSSSPLVIIGDPVGPTMWIVSKMISPHINQLKIDALPINIYSFRWDAVLEWRTNFHKWNKKIHPNRICKEHGDLHTVTLFFFWKNLHRVTYW